jgi:hypothetical protein
VQRPKQQLLDIREGTQTHPYAIEKNLGFGFCNSTILWVVVVVGVFHNNRRFRVFEKSKIKEPSVPVISKTSNRRVS